ncbi:MAG: protein arginine kinase, partial [Sedimentisphaerales bacterium]|nr:protein arginine kinase [Sedimentisphaerales bacterium]
SLDELGNLERQVLQERQLISRQHAQGDGARGVAISHDESLTLMINEEDHLRMQILASGLQLTELYERINRVDDLLESNISYAFSSELGYLTACPTNVGTGIRVSVMLHLPALKLTGRMKKFFRAAKDMNLAVRGLFGEGTEPAGDLYQLSNQVTLGRSEEQIIRDLMENAVVPTVQYERQARQFLQHHRSTALEDKIFRAVGVLRNARMISSDECKYLLSLLRLGIHLERITDISLGVVNELFILTQPGHLQHLRGTTLEPQQRDMARAELVRQYLN